MSNTTNIVIVYHSGYGHTKKLAEAVHAGVKHVGANVSLLSVIDITDEHWTLLENADAIIFGSPTYMGTVSAEFKKFADATSKPWFGQKWKNKIAAGFTNSASMNGDKYNTIQCLWDLSQQHGMIWVGLGLLPSNSKAAQRNDINYMGSYTGLMAQSPSDSTPEEGPLPGDLKTGELFGERVAKITEQFIRGKN
jgi:NAD(P)H dehydrogenase (quinone)